MTPDFGQAPAALTPPTVVDHVLLPVTDLDEGARRLHERYGLDVLAGGRHPGMGTANLIVPLGLQYLELITIADDAEAATSSLGRAVIQALAGGRTFVAWALRTADLDALRAKLERAGRMLPEMTEGTRPRPDGTVLRWRTQNLVEDGRLSALPFVIQWDIPHELHPGRAPAGHTASLRRVVVGARDPAGVREELALLLGETPLVEVQDAPEDGVLGVVLTTPGGELVIE